MFRLLLSIFVFKNCYLGYTSLLPMLGPTDLKFQSFTTCDPTSSDFTIKITQRRYNRTVNLLDIELFTAYELDARIELELKSAIKADGGYKPGSFYMKDKLCAVLKTMLGDVFQKFLESSGTEDCPIPSGKYEVPGFYLDNNKYSVPQIYGEHRTTANLYRDGELIACHIVYVEVAPKDKY